MARRAWLLAIATILVHLAGTFGGYLHFALVEHERCPEHGELVHADGVAASPDLSSSPTGVHSGPTAAPGNRDSRDSHDPCSLTAALRQRAFAPDADAGAQIEELFEPAPGPAAESPFLAARARYRVAPKTSPPERA